MRVIVIDDNQLLNPYLSKIGYQLQYCSNIDSIDNIINKFSRLDNNEYDKVFINISILCKDSTRRLDYFGLKIYKRLLNYVYSKKWYLVSFENIDSLKKKIVQLHSYNDLEIINYIIFLKEIEHEQE